MLVVCRINTATSYNSTIWNLIKFMLQITDISGLSIETIGFESDNFPIGTKLEVISTSKRKFYPILSKFYILQCHTVMAYLMNVHKMLPSLRLRLFVILS